MMVGPVPSFSAFAVFFFVFANFLIERNHLFNYLIRKLFEFLSSRKRYDHANLIFFFFVEFLSTWISPFILVLNYRTLFSFYVITPSIYFINSFVSL